MKLYRAYGRIDPPMCSWYNVIRCPTCPWRRDGLYHTIDISSLVACLGMAGGPVGLPGRTSYALCLPTIVKGAP